MFFDKTELIAYNSAALDLLSNQAKFQQRLEKAMEKLNDKDVFISVSLDMPQFQLYRNFNTYIGLLQFYILLLLFIRK